MKKILCPTDFSDTANNAIAYAAKLAQIMGAELTLFNVESLFDFTPEELLVGTRATLERTARNLQAQSRQVELAFRISCSADVESSSNKLSTAIREKAQGYNLIVMGTNGADDLYQFFGGSNAYNAILKANVPLMLIPAGVAYSEIRSVVFAFDYLKERSLPIAGLKPLVSVLKSKLTVLQVLEESYSQYVEDDIRDMQYILKSWPGEIDYEFDSIRSSEAPQAINSYMLQHHADVLALCSVHRNVIERFFHKSTIKSLSNFCQYPVYVFHAEKGVREE